MPVDMDSFITVNIPFCFLERQIDIFQLGNLDSYGNFHLDTRLFRYDTKPFKQLLIPISTSTLICQEQQIKVMIVFAIANSTIQFQATDTPFAQFLQLNVDFLAPWPVP